MKDTITSRGVSFRRPLGDEKTEQASIQNLVAQLGGTVYVLGSRRAMCCGICGAPSTDRSTRQTEGLGDLAVFLPPTRRQLDRAWHFVWIECKGRRGELSPEQVRFRELNQAAGVPHVVGGIDEFVAYLERGGWVRIGA